MYTMETMSELYNIKELIEGTFNIPFKLIYHYQQGERIRTGKLKCATYKKGYFHRGQNTTELVTYKDKIVTPQLLQKYLVKWYHTHLLHPGLDQTEAMI